MSHGSSMGTVSCPAAFCDTFTSGYPDFWRKLTAAGLLLFATITLSNNAFAADWIVLPSVTLSAEYTDNKQLRASDQPEVSATGAAVDALLSLEYATPRSNLRIIPRLRSTKYDENRFDDNDQFLVIMGTRQGLRTELRFDAALERESIFTAEIADANFDDFAGEVPDFSDTGVLEGSARRELVRASPTLLFTPNEIWELGLSASVLAVDYEEALQDQRVPFDDYSVMGTISRRISERSRIGVAPFAGRFETDNGVNETDSVGVDLQLTTDFSPTLAGRFSLGAQDTETTLAVPGDPLVSLSETASRAAIGLVKTSEVTKWSLDLIHSIFPNGSGFLFSRDEIRFAYERAMSERFSLNTAFRVFTSEPANALTVRKRDYLRASLGFDYQLSRNWVTGVIYSFTRQDNNNQFGDADANRITASISYRPQRPR